MKCQNGQICDPSGTRENPCISAPDVGELLLCYRREYNPTTTADPGTTTPSIGTTETAEPPTTTAIVTTDTAINPSSTMDTTTTDSAENPTSTLPTSTDDEGQVPTGSTPDQTSTPDPTTTEIPITTSPPITTSRPQPPPTINDYMKELCMAPRVTQNISFPPDTTCSIYIACQGTGESTFGELKGCPIKQLFDKSVGICVPSVNFVCR